MDPAQLIYDTGVNLLAHAFLANGDPDRIVGQLCGDFVRGSDLEAYAASIQAGIRCHRAVDTFTDKHPDNIAAFLACDWQQYSDVPLPEYTALVTQSLESRFEVLPEGLQRFKGLLEVENTLYRNLYRDHIGLTLQRIASRRKSMAPLATIEPLVWQHEQSLKRSFERFFPQLVSYTITYQKKLATQGLDRER